MFLTEDPTRFMMPWETLGALVRGISAIDLTSMPIADREEAYNFVLNYGYDLHRPEDAEEIQRIFEEAVRFIENCLLDTSVDWEAQGERPSPADQVPRRLIASGDPLDLLILASQGSGEDKHWACAILKVMHTLAHIQNGPFYKHFDDAKKQILERFYAILTPLEDGVMLGNPKGKTLRLYGFETKDEKTRESILVKLLCKKEHVAEAIWDLIGIRIITHTPAEALYALEILRAQKVVVFPNIIPSRSRNTLIDLETFQKEYESVFDDFVKGKKNLQEMEAFFHQEKELHTSLEKDFTAHNPLSSQHYRSIHVTCRQLIRSQLSGSTYEMRFFFPYEIQILDRASYLESKEGTSAHRQYKKKQFALARRRVLGLLLKPDNVKV
jgi:uncharacterized protein (TIGR04562 family)